MPGETSEARKESGPPTSGRGNSHPRTPRPTATYEHHRLERFPQTPLAFTTWAGMFGSGVRIGIGPITSQRLLQMESRTIRKVPPIASIRRSPAFQNGCRRVDPFFVAIATVRDILPAAEAAAQLRAEAPTPASAA